MIKPGDLHFEAWMIGLRIAEFEYQAGTEMFRKELYVVAHFYSKTSTVEARIILL